MVIETESAIVNNKPMTELQQAVRWFKENDVHAYEDDGSVYIVVASLDLEIQVSTSEVSYRAELYREEQENDS